MKIKKGQGKKLIVFYLLTVFLFSFSFIACQDKALTPYSDNTDSIYVNNRLKLKGNFCNQEPGNSILPVKILFVLDHSASLGPFGDPDGTDTDQADGTNERQNAVRAVLDEYSSNPAYFFGQILFSNNIDLCQDPGGDGWLDWNNLDRAGYEPCITSIYNPHNWTRMHDGLLEAYNQIDHDLKSMPKRLQRRTTYIVILFTDGIPDDGIGDCEFGQPVENQPAFEEEPVNIVKIASDIMRLDDEDAEIRAREIIINTIFLKPPAIPLMKAGPCEDLDEQSELLTFARDLLGQIASIGNGTFFETGVPQNLDFLQFVRTSVKSVFGLKTFIVANLNARLDGNGDLVADSDADGLSDAFESLRGYNLRDKDSDSDGLGDKIEVLLGRNVNIDDGICAPHEFGDTDFDGLNDCEERMLQTDDQLPDSDGDGILDMLEVYYDTDPLFADSNMDNNQDGVFNGYEIAVHTEPGYALSDDSKQRYAYRYTVNYDEGLSEELIDCFDFEIGNISLVKPVPRDGYPAGLNDILVYYIESLIDDPNEFGDTTIGHYQALYLGSGYKYPQSGQFELDDFSDFNVIGKIFEINPGF